MDHWATCCHTNLVQQATAILEYLTGAISDDEMLKTNENEETGMLKINSITKLAKGEIRIVAEVDVMTKRVFDQEVLNLTSI